MLTNLECFALSSFYIENKHFLLKSIQNLLLTHDKLHDLSLGFYLNVKELHILLKGLKETKCKLNKLELYPEGDPVIEEEYVEIVTMIQDLEIYDIGCPPAWDIYKVYDHDN